MFRNFLIVTVRSFLRQKFYSGINVLGLTAGLVCTLFIYLWVNSEISKDKFHANIDSLYQIVTNLKWDADVVTWESTPGPLADEIRASIPEITAVARTSNDGGQIFQVGEKSFTQQGYFADPDFFKIFSFEIVQGNSTMPVQGKSDVAISASLAKKLFGDENAIGKTVRVQNKYDQQVTAVFADVPDASSLKFDFIMPFEVHKEYRQLDWSNADYNLYITASTPQQAAAAITKINDFVYKLILQEDPNADRDRFSFYMQPFGERYLNSTFENGVPVGGRIKYVQIFSIVGVFMLIIACINFMNMATAKAATRSKEVGVRKVIGAQRKSLITQFIGESMAISLIAMIIALIIVYLLLPVFNSVVSKQIVIDFTDPYLIMALISIVIITGLLAGGYPAFFLSAYQPAHVLKGNTHQSLSGTALRKGLVVFQFSLTVILIACSLVVYTQIEYIRTKNIGYNREAVMSFNARGKVLQQFESFRQEALQQPSVKMISRANASLVEIANQNASVSWPGKAEDNRVFFRTVVCDYDFPETMGLTLQQGRFFKKEFNDTNNFIVNAHAVAVMGLRDPIGQEITQWGSRGKIVGVVDDFHGRSLHESIDPMVLMCKPDWTNTIFVKTEGAQTQQAIAHLETLSKKFNPQYEFPYTFLDDDFEKLYTTEKVTGSLALGFTFMAIVISGLGLLGLAAYTAERKRKEIGIRKTMGASVSGIVAGMASDFIKLSVIAACIGCPIAYYLMDIFLKGYAYHTELTWWLFACTAVCVMIISLVTVIFQTTKAAIANPIDALRNE